MGEGLYTDMNAIRRDEQLDNLHSVYVDQWDWEKVISPEMRSLATLKDAMQRIVTAICATQDLLQWRFSSLDRRLTREMAFITTQELEDLYPSLSPKERENRFTRHHGTAGILQIGGRLRSGRKHDDRAPDYDDWELNGDILFWDEMLGCAMEISSMGVRVSPESLDRQLSLAGCEDRRQLPFHQALLSGALPYTLGGGIGQSRTCMLLLNKAHIGEVQSSYWDEATQRLPGRRHHPLVKEPQHEGDRRTVWQPGIQLRGDAQPPAAEIYEALRRTIITGSACRRR